MSVAEDQFAEQTYTWQGRGTGGLKGISPNADQVRQVAVEVAFFLICSQSIDSLDYMYPSSDKETRTERKKHKGKESKGRQLEVSDRHMMCTELQKYSHPLTSSSNHLYDTITGQAAVADINKHQADELGTTIQNDFIASHPGGIRNTISSKGKTTKSKKRKQQRWTTSLCLTSTPCFARQLIVGQKRDISIPTSLINDGYLRKSDKSILI